MEIPILLVLIIIVSVIVIPQLSPFGQKILLSIAVVPVLFALFYMIVIPGWMPSDKARLKWPWNWLVFLTIAILIVMGVVLFDLS